MKKLAPLIAGVTSALVAALVLPSLPADISSKPQYLGRIGSVDIDVCAGNIAIPNRLVRTSPKTWEVDNRIAYWDTYLITAPSPDVVRTPTTVTLTVPWTLLPGSVVSTVQQIDPWFGQVLSDELSLKQSTADWSFDRIVRLTIPSESTYSRTTGVRSIYSVNMFEFLKELGSDYQSNLATAVSAATKEVLEQAGTSGEHKLAIPALAGAENVIDRYLVISYRESFAAILDGIERAQGPTPSRVVLVVWRDLEGHREFEAVRRGLRLAALSRVPEWSKALQGLAAITLAAGIVVGVLLNQVGAGRQGTGVAFVLAALGLLAGVLTHKYVETLAALLPLTSLPWLEMGVVGAVACSLGMLLHHVGLTQIGEKPTGRQ